MLLNVIVIAARVARSHTIGFQCMIFAPSNTLKGRRLKNAMKPLTAYPRVAMPATMPVEDDAVKGKIMPVVCLWWVLLMLFYHFLLG